MNRCEGCHKDYEGEGWAVLIPHPTDKDKETVFKLVCEECKRKLILAWNSLGNGSRYVT